MSEIEEIDPPLPARLKRWQRHADILKYEVWGLHHHRNLWRQMREALVKASPDEGTYLDHYDKLYVDSQCVAVRRLVDLDPRSVSVARLLTDLARHPESMTRAHHVQLWTVPGDSDDVRDRWQMEEAEATFDEYTDGGGDNIDPIAVLQDLEHWKAIAGPIKKFVDKRIAHLADIDESEIPKATYIDLDKAIDTVAEYIRKYTLLFTASSIAMMEPSIPRDWKRPFRNPLFSR
jgi:AbiU2